MSSSSNDRSGGDDSDLLSALGSVIRPFTRTEKLREEIWGAEALNQYQKECKYLRKIGAGIPESTINSADAYIKTRSDKDLLAIKIGTDTLFAKLGKLEDQALATRIKQALAHPFDVPEDSPLHEAKKKFERDTKAVNGVLQADNPSYTYHPDHLSKMLIETTRNPMHTAIKNNEEHETTELNACFENNPDLQALKTLWGESDFNQLKEESLKSIKAAQNTKLDAFKNEINKNAIDKILQDTQHQNKKYEYLMAMYKHSKAMRDEIDKNANRTQVAHGPQNRVNVLVEDGVASFPDIDIESLEALETITGRKLSFKKDEKTGELMRNKDGSAILKMPLPQYGYFYFDPLHHDKPLYDFVSFAWAIKAAAKPGLDGIEIKINNSNPEEAKKRGREAVLGCIKSGCYLKDQITIKVPLGNDDKKDEKSKDDKYKIISIDELFAENQNELKAAIEQATLLQENYDAYEKARYDTPEQETRRFRGEMDEQRLKIDPTYVPELDEEEEEQHHAIPTQS